MRSTLCLFALVILPSFVSIAQSSQDSASARISGEFFGDLYYFMDSENAANEGESGFLIRRGTLTYDYSHNRTFRSRLRMEADQAAVTGSNRLLVYIKDAYLQWRGMLGAGHDAVFGISPTPSFQTSEEFWGYRSLEKTILDHRGLVSSRDIGLDFKGGLAGNASYWLKLGNNSIDGRGTSLRMYGTVKLSITQQAVMTLSSDWHKGESTFPGFGVVKGNRTVVAGFIGYIVPTQYSIGVEGVYRLQEANDLVNPTTLENLKTSGFSTFSWVSLAQTWKLIARYDYLKANSRVPESGLHYLLIGLDYSPSRTIHVMPNVVLQDRKSASGSDISGRLTVFFTY